MKIIKSEEKLNNLELAEIAEKLRNGGLVIYPTDTAYGIGALCTSEAGVSKLFEYKGRREGKPVSVGVCTREMAEKYVVINTVAEEIYQKFLPGAFTIISKLRKDRVGQGSFKLLAPSGTLGVRIPAHKIVQQITGSLNEGITSTSANESGGLTPYSISDVLDNISDMQKNLIDLVIDYGTLPPRDTSTIIDTTTVPAAVLRGDVDILNKISFSENQIVCETGDESKLNDFAAEIIAEISRERKIAERLNAVDKPVVLLLHGEMGAGKTRLTQAIANNLGIKANVISPSFVLERQYDIPSHDGVKANLPGIEKLYHYDFWRLDREAACMKPAALLRSLGLGQALRPGNLLIIEWPEKIKKLELLLDGALKYKIDIKIAGSGRKFIMFKV